MSLQRCLTNAKNMRYGIAEEGWGPGVYAQCSWRMNKTSNYNEDGNNNNNDNTFIYLKYYAKCMSMHLTDLQLPGI